MGREDLCHRSMSWIRHSEDDVAPGSVLLLAEQGHGTRLKEVEDVVGVDVGFVLPYAIPRCDGPADFSESSFEEVAWIKSLDSGVESVDERGMVGSCAIVFDIAAVVVRLLIDGRVNLSSLRSARSPVDVLRHQHCDTDAVGDGGRLPRCVYYVYNITARPVVTFPL